MSNLIEDAQGNLLHVRDFERLGVEEVKNLIKKLKEDLAIAEAYIAKVEGQVEQEIQNDTTQAPAEGQPVQPVAADLAPASPAPAPAVENPAPADPNAVAPADPTAPAPTEPAPATDPAGNPITLQ